MGLGRAVGLSDGSLIVSSAVLSSSSPTGSREARRWLLACEAVSGHSMGVLVDSLEGPGHSLSRHVRHSSRGSGVGFCDIKERIPECVGGFVVLFYCQVWTL